MMNLIQYEIKANANNTTTLLPVFLDELTDTKLSYSWDFPHKFGTRNTEFERAIDLLERWNYTKFRDPNVLRILPITR